MANKAIEGLDLSFAQISESAPVKQSEVLDLSFLDEKPAKSAAFDPEQNEGVGPGESFLVGVGRGFMNVGRGIGLAEKEDPIVKQALENLQKRHPVAVTGGTIVGEAAPFVVPGSAVGAIGSNAARVGGATVLGAVEGNIISRGNEREETLKDTGIGGVVAGGFELLSGPLGRVGRALIKRLGKKVPPNGLLTRSGRPTPEFQKILDDAGVDFDALSDATLDAITGADPGSVVDDAARAARFRGQGIPATTGDITQDFATQAQEERLLSMASGASGEPLRQLKLEQSEAFKGAVENLVDGLGIPDESGEAVKSALIGRKSLLEDQKKRLYREFAQSAPELRAAPILNDRIREAVPDAKTMRRLGRIKGSNIDALEDLLVEFGIDDAPERVERFIQSGGQIEPLTIGNFDDFRVALNQLTDGVDSGAKATAVAVSPIKKALDEEAAFIDDAMKASGLADDSVLAPLKQARETVRTLKTEFSKDSVVGRLTGVRRDGVTPIIESSRVFDELTRRPVEDVDRVVASLLESGDPGKKALGDLQATAVLRALNNALKAPSRRTSGIETVAGNMFVKELRKIGDDKLELLFKTNRSALNQLRELSQTAIDITPNAATTPKGSAPVILDLLNRGSRVPGIAAVVDALKFVINAGADDRAVSRALRGKPRMTRTVKAIQQEYPAIASVFAIPVLTRDGGEETVSTEGGEVTN